MKKFFTVLAVAAMVAAGAFAMDFSLNLSADSYNFSTINPNLGVDLGFGKMDVLAGLKFNIQSRFGDDNGLDYMSFTPYAGVYFPVVKTGKLTFGPEAVAEIGINKDEKIYGNEDIHFALNTLFGARLSCALNDKWSAWTAFQMNLLSFQFGDTTIMNFLAGGYVQLGVAYKF
jgi:hypothetical protein